MEIRIEHGVGGAKNAVSRGDAVLIVDTIRASTTYVNAFASGAKRIVPCLSREPWRNKICYCYSALVQNSYHSFV